MKKMLSLMTAILMIMSLMMMGATASEGTTDPLAPSGFDPLAIGAKDDRTNKRVSEMQQKLIDLGYLKSKADGRFGEQTQAALQAFQQANNLPVTGVYDQADDTVLLSETAINVEGTTGATVVKPQITYRSTVDHTPDTTPDNTPVKTTSTTTTTTTTRTNTPDNTPDTTPDNTPEKKTTKKSSSKSDDTPDNTPDDTPEKKTTTKKSSSKSDDTPDNTPDNTPEKKTTKKSSSKADNSPDDSKDD